MKNRYKILRHVARTIVVCAGASMFFLTGSHAATAQDPLRKFRFDGNKWVEIVEEIKTVKAVEETLDESAEAEKVLTIDDIKLKADTTIDVSGKVFPEFYYLPTVFDGYDLRLSPDSIKDMPQLKPADSPFRWVDDAVETADRFRRFKQQYTIANPSSVNYNINTLPEAPKRFRAFVDPSSASITIEEVQIDQEEIKNDVKPIEIKKKHWLYKFDGLVQFSQAYNSPNWYQGGNNNLNAIANAVYNLKLNQAFHPNLLFENTIQYKLALNSAPDDTLRNYSISEDLFQINSKFGVKAAKRWYYSATMQFKTQLLNNYKKNTRDRVASFLSPGELNFGLGMTYDYSNASGKLKFNASMAPISYNLKICTDEFVDETLFGIKEGRKTASQYGSNIDCKLTWQIAYNIYLVSHLTAFSDYSYIQSDWENTLSFSINKFLSTQIYLHLRYDSQAPSDYDWHKFQLKEILSFGFAYNIGTI